jgi:TolB-like protein
MSFIDELKRRKVVRVGVAYAIVAWLLIEVASVLLPTFDAPDWVMKAFSSLVILGFPLALIFAWAFELTPEGIKRDRDVDRSDSESRSSGRRLDFIIITSLAIALSGVIWMNYFRTPETGTDKSIAVLPFTNMSADPANDYFSDGLSDTLLHRLAQIRDLTVTARTSSFQFKGQNLDVRDIGEQLGVAYVLEGSVQKSGDQLRVIAQLIETESGTHVASMEFSRTLADIFAIQDEIAERIVKELRIALLADEATRLRRRETDSLEAYDEYLLGRQLIAEAGYFAAFGVAAEHFRTAVELDPGFVSAYIGQALTWMMSVEWGGTVLDTGANETRRLLANSERLDPDHPEYSLIKAWLAWIDGDAREAERLFREHMDAVPNSDVGVYFYAFFLQNQLRFAESVDLVERSRRLNPLSPRLEALIAWAEAGTGQSAAGRDRYIRISQSYPEYSEAHAYLAGEDAEFGEIHTGLRRVDESIAASGFGSELRADLLLRLRDTSAAESLLGANPDRGDLLTNLRRALIELHYDRVDNAIQIAKDSLQRKGQRSSTVINFTRIARLANPDDLDAIRNSYELAIPALVNGRRFDEQVFYWSIGFAPRDYAKAAVDYAGLLIEMGNADRAAKYIADVESFIAQVPRMDWWGYGILDAELAAVQGNRDAALDALEAAIDAGWMEDWWFNEKYNPNLASLHGDPRYEALFKRLTNKAAEQLALYRAGSSQ